MTVRAYDTKAQIIGVGYIFALGVVARIDELLPQTSHISVLAVLIAWGVILLPIFLFGYVLYPTRKTAPEISQEVRSKLEYVLYIDPARHTNVAELRTSISRCDAIDEYAFELLKVTKLRELKRKRFLRALFATATAFIILFIGHLEKILS